MSANAADLIDRTYRFAADIRKLVNQLPRTLAAIEDGKQLIRSSGSVAANYLEAQEGLSRRDFFFRIKICRKEARESALWLRLLGDGESGAANGELVRLQDEALQLTRVFSAIVAKERQN